MNTQSFASNASDPRRRALIDTVINVAERLDLDVIGEGVETAEQAHFLAEAGCHPQQAFYHGKPSAAEALTQAWTAA